MATLRLPPAATASNTFPGFMRVSRGKNRGPFRYGLDVLPLRLRYRLRVAWRLYRRAVRERDERMLDVALVYLVPRAHPWDYALDACSCCGVTAEALERAGGLRA